MPSSTIFSVVIPTLQRSGLLWPMLDRYTAHPLVGEVILINNAPERVRATHPKVRVIQQEENIFVNPAWNLGVSESRFPFLVIANDDLLFDTRLLDLAARWLRRPGVGIIGPDLSCLSGGGGRPRLRPAYQLPDVFGSLMFMRRERYSPIPDGLKIWFGDDLLFNSQRHRNFVFLGHPVETPMAVTSSAAEFRPMFDTERSAYLAAAAPGYPERYRWEHRAVTALRIVRGAVTRLLRAS